MIDFLRKAFRLGRQATQNVEAASAMEAAYAHYKPLPAVLRAFSGATEAKADDSADEAVLAALGQLKQTAYNGAQILRGLIPLIEGIAAQCDEVYEFLDKAEREPLKELLEG